MNAPIYLKLLATFLKIGVFCFGGGYAMLPLIQREVVFVEHWLTDIEFSSIVAVSQITPGPIAINAATFAGYKAAGVAGSVFSTAGIILVSLILVTLTTKNLERFKTNIYVQGFLRGIAPAVIAMLAFASYNMMGDTAFDPLYASVAAAAFAVSYFTGVSSILVMAAGAIIGIMLYLL